MVGSDPAKAAVAAGPADPATVPLRIVRPPTPPVPEQRAAVAAVDGTVSPALRRMVPLGWRGARVDPGRPGALALALVAAAAAVVAAIGVWSERPRAEPVPTLPVVAAAPDAPAPGTDPPPSSGPLVVSVAGKVRRPGLVEVPDGARVADAVAAAGGPLPDTDLTGINLARKVGDGEQIAVGIPPAPDAGGGAGDPGADPPTGRLDLNLATAAQLDALPGVGPVTAERILEWRSRNGRFSRVEQLREVEGIGEQRFGQLRELVTV